MSSKDLGGDISPRVSTGLLDIGWYGAHTGMIGSGSGFLSLGAGSGLSSSGSITTTLGAVVPC